MLGILSEEQKNFESEDAEGGRDQEMLRVGREMDLEHAQDGAAEGSKSEAKAEDGQQCEEALS